ALLGTEEHLDGQRFLQIAAVRDALAEQLGVLIGHDALARREQRLQRPGLRARLRGAFIGFEPGGVLAMETVAEPAAERGAEHEADGAAGRRTDHGAAAEADRLFLRRNARLARLGSRGTIFRPREARRGEQAADDQDNEFLL